MTRLSLAAVGLLVLLALASVHMQNPTTRVNAEETEVSETSDFAKVEETVGGAIPVGLSTDSEVVQRESESISPKTLRKHSETYEFQAEVSRLMDILINSLYSNKDIFLREIISNASDALDKIRFLSLLDKAVLGEGDDAKLDIRIKLDKANKILSITDKGVGMTKEELIKNLGTIAKSGTSSFVENLQKGGDLNLIGQFGVGFYSVYLVADYVEVISKHNDDKQYIWESKADGNFAISEDTENEPLGRGTEIRLHLKEEAVEYLEEGKLRELVKKYSEFINFPIYLLVTKEKVTEVPVDEVSEAEEETEESDEETDEETEEVEDLDESGKTKPKTKKVRESVEEWEILNSVKAVWLRDPKEVSADDYAKFYAALSKDFSADKPISYTHFSAEGDVEFKAILFIPPKAPQDLFDNYYNNKATLKLFVRRVFISEEFDELLPKYLSFLKGIVDSDTLPLNVSREMLQAHNSLKTIKKKLIRKALDMIRRLCDEDPDEKFDSPADTEDVEEEETNDKKGQYLRFWNEFGKAIKLGLIEDASNRVRLAKLLRFESSKSGDKLTSLDQYVSRMKDTQKQIYYITGQSKEQLAKSPFLEKLLKKGYEVIYFTDPLDEYLMQNLSEYEDRKFQNVSKDDLKIGSKNEKAKFKEVKEEFKDLTKWWKNVLGADKVETVKISNRLAGTPGVVVSSKFGWTANMERIMQAQTLTDVNKQSYMKGKRTLEINPRHPIIMDLKDKVAENPEDDTAQQSAHLVYETALLESGFLLEDPKAFASHVYQVLRDNLAISPDAEIEEEPETEDTEEEEEEKEIEVNEDEFDPDELEDADEENLSGEDEDVNEPETFSGEDQDVDEPVTLSKEDQDADERETFSGEDQDVKEPKHDEL